MVVEAERLAVCLLAVTLYRVSIHCRISATPAGRCGVVRARAETVLEPAFAIILRIRGTWGVRVAPNAGTRAFWSRFGHVVCGVTTLSGVAVDPRDERPR